MNVRFSMIEALSSSHPQREAAPRVGGLFSTNHVTRGVLTTRPLFVRAHYLLHCVESLSSRVTGEVTPSLPAAQVCTGRLTLSREAGSSSFSLSIIAVAVATGAGEAQLASAFW